MLSPLATILSELSGSGLCSLSASSAGAFIQTSISSRAVRTTGIAFGWIAPTSLFGSVVRSYSRQNYTLDLKGRFCCLIRWANDLRQCAGFDRRPRPRRAGEPVARCCRALGAGREISAKIAIGDFFPRYYGELQQPGQRIGERTMAYSAEISRDTKDPTATLRGSRSRLQTRRRGSFKTPLGHYLSQYRTDCAQDCFERP